MDRKQEPYPDTTGKETHWRTGPGPCLCTPLKRPKLSLSEILASINWPQNSKDVSPFPTANATKRSLDGSKKALKGQQGNTPANFIPLVTSSPRALGKGLQEPSPTERKQLRRPFEGYSSGTRKRPLEGHPSPIDHKKLKLSPRPKRHKRLSKRPRRNSLVKVKITSERRSLRSKRISPESQPEVGTYDDVLQFSPRERKLSNSLPPNDPQAESELTPQQTKEKASNEMPNEDVCQPKIMMQSSYSPSTTQTHVREKKDSQLSYASPPPIPQTSQTPDSSRKPLENEIVDFDRIKQNGHCVLTRKRYDRQDVQWTFPIAQRDSFTLSYIAYSDMSYMLCQVSGDGRRILRKLLNELPSRTIPFLEFVVPDFAMDIDAVAMAIGLPAIQFMGDIVDDFTLEEVLGKLLRYLNKRDPLYDKIETYIEWQKD